jgi:hypothetical protein
MARPPRTRRREARLLVGLIVADVHSPWAVWVACDADLGRTRLAASNPRQAAALVAQSRAGATLRSRSKHRQELEKVPLPHCGATATIGETTPIGDKCPNTISQRKSNDEADYYESDFEGGRHARQRWP